MDISNFAKEYIDKMLPEYKSDLLDKDPEFMERFCNFAYDEVINECKLDERIRFISIIATLIGCQGIDEFKIIVKAALNNCVTPMEIKEIIYQAVPYLGIGRVLPFFYEVNNIFEDCKIELPLEEGKTTTNQDRLEKGAGAQIDIFGESMRDFYKSGPEETRHINRWLASNCFGDYYTRKWLNYNERELITFCFLASQGGVEPQLISHAKANLRLGNSKQFLISVVSTCLPYIGYPRSLNAIRCINEAEK